MARTVSFYQKKGARLPMPILKDLAVAGSALLVFLMVSGAYFGDGESNSRFEASLYQDAIYAPRPQQAAELRFPRDVTPADRVRQVFDRFVPDETRRAGKS
jgi:hypothetical protein